MEIPLTRIFHTATRIAAVGGAEYKSFSLRTSYCPFVEDFPSLAHAYQLASSTPDRLPAGHDVVFARQPSCVDQRLKMRNGLRQKLGQICAAVFIPWQLKWNTSMQIFIHVGHKRLIGVQFLGRLERFCKLHSTLDFFGAHGFANLWRSTRSFGTSKPPEV